MAKDIALHDWSSTPLGPLEDWPVALKITVSTMLNSAFPKCLCWGEELIVIYNDAFRAILDRKHPCLGQSFLDVWAETVDSIRPITEKAMQGQATFIEDFRIVTNRSGESREAFFTFCYGPVRDENGTVRGMLDTVVETTDKVLAERSAELRNQELVHRSRNAYALVSALINQTFRGSLPPEQIKMALQDRISALVRAQDTLTEDNAAGGLIEVVALGALQPFMNDSQRVTVSGPRILLGREQVMALSLALHELATNSTKYGALSADAGQVALSWAVEGQGEGTQFRLVWQESGGPEVVAPKGQGFGSRIIAGVLPSAFSGTVNLEYALQGLTLQLLSNAASLISADDRLAADIRLTGA
ncbi:HWE histidine kinase domain-containing protein [Pseudooceanicola sp. HF7]|uniref:HWE histidine kinase domain-containing protein n=1 Tax=Pseudooceanicola sp. HF7 TaxID=2721560 RepID=UPI0014319A2E|nr:HWE histidine kinase domain-containing protein [Pseudooceanicola sp. HF7]NIZ08176.1 PAS domain-containing protein [Pseudooceanicola sp. HF7]